MKKLKLCVWLFLINLFISSFTFGGGYVVIPMVRKYFVLRKKLIGEEELLDLAAISQSMPGAIAVNLVSLAGYRAAGMAGALISLAGAVLPPLAILSAVSFWYAAFRSSLLVSAVLKGMEAAVAALIVDLVIDMYAQLVKRKERFLSLLAPAAFFASFFLKADAALILAAGCICFLILQAVSVKRAEKISSKEDNPHDMDPVS